MPQVENSSVGLTLPRWVYWGLGVLGVVVLYQSREVLPPFIVSFVLAYILDPFVTSLEKKGVSRLGSILRVYVLGLLAIVLFIALIVPPVIRQVNQLERSITRYLQEVHREGLQEQDRQRAAPVDPGKTGAPSATPEAPAAAGEDRSAQVFYHEISIFWLGLTNRYPALREHFGDENAVIQALRSRQEEIGKYTVMVLSGVSSWAFSSLSQVILLILVPLLTFYFLTVLDPMKKRILYLIPERGNRDALLAISSDINVMLGKYLKGQIFVSLLVGVAVTLATYVASLFFHTKYSLLLGCLTGVTCIIPYFGALVSLTAGALIGLFTATTSPIVAALVIMAILALINQAFDNLITPKIVGDSVGLHPIWTLFALLAGGKFIGLAGMLIAVPIAATVQIVLLRLFPKLVEPIPDAAPSDDPAPQVPGPPAPSGSPPAQGAG